tara:strand:- start:237 stop:362 length:126 start_codon:yes stop_codon:yes gene_type:complete
MKLPSKICTLVDIPKVHVVTYQLLFFSYPNKNKQQKCVDHH